MAVDFRKLLKKPLDEVKRPPALPAGTYHGVVAKYEFGESRDKKTPFIRFFFTITSADDSIDPGELAGIELAKKQQRRDFYLTDDALYRLKEFIASCGIETAGHTTDELLADTLQAPVLMEITQRNSDDGETIYNDIAAVKGTASAAAATA
jgi:hypothetical protein